MLRRWLGRARALVRKEAVDREMDEEMRFHLELETEAAIRAGLPPEEARRRARVAFGGVERYREEARAARGVSALEDVAQDLRYGVRALRQNPIFTTVAVLTLALGIGANAAIFSVVNGVVLRSLPYPDPDELVSVWDGGHSRAEFTRVRDQQQTLHAVALYRGGVGMSLSGDGEPQLLVGAHATADLFRVLRVVPALGRGFAEGEDRPGNDRVAVLSHALWRGRFGGDSSVLGRTLDLDGIPRVVIGVMPRGFGFPTTETELWVPLVLDEREGGVFWGIYGHWMVGRLRSGVTRELVRDEVRAIAERLRHENPYWTPDERYVTDVDVIPLRERVVGESGRLLVVLLGAVGIVLLIACANVANLLLARGAAREQEIAVRGTLGAARGRLVRQLVTESLLLAGVGALVGLGLAVGGVRLLVALLPPDTPRLAEVVIDGRVLAFTVTLALVAGMAFGLAPALRLSHTMPALALGEGTQRGGSGREQRRFSRLLVATEIALAVMLAIGAGLLVRSLDRLMQVDPGFRTHHIVTARVSPPEARYADPDVQRAFYRQLLERLEASPAVASAAVTSQLPFDQVNDLIAMWVEGYTTTVNQLELFEIRRVSPGFFATMGIEVLEGRGFSDADRADGPAVAIIDETAARRYWKQGDAVGGGLRYPWPVSLEIVGVVRSVKNNDLAQQPRQALYVPFAQRPSAGMTMVVRAASDPGGALAAVRAAVSELASDVPVSDERSMAQLIRDSAATPRVASVLLASFGALALLLGAVGVYGLMAYAAQRRTREIAVRMALGAPARKVLGTIVGEAVALTAVGVTSGLGLAWALTRLLQGFLFEVTATDPLTFVAAPALLTVVVLFASYLPARRAARLDPMRVIRGE